MALSILFDSMGTQAQVQAATGKRLTTWIGSMTALGYTVNFSDHTLPLANQLSGVDVLVSTTRQYAGPGNSTIPAGTNFSYPSGDLGFLQTWVNGGGNILQFTNHSVPWGSGPYWPLNEIQLASALGIPLVFASFAPTGDSPVVQTGCQLPLATLRMSPNSSAPSTIIRGVTTVEAWDSGGIVNPGLDIPTDSQVSGGTVLIPLPGSGSCTDTSGLGYNPAQCAFSVLYTIGQGSVIVVGHSGITGNFGTCAPSPGQITFADNQTFLNNCMAYFAAN